MLYRHDVISSNRSIVAKWARRGLSVSEQFRWRPQGVIPPASPPRRPQASRTSPQANPRRSSALVEPPFLRLLRRPAAELGG